METMTILEKSLEKVGCEIWRDVKGYGGFYQVSNMGRVRSFKRWDNKMKRHVDGRIRKATDNGNGYLVVSLCKNGERKNHYVHRLVAVAFVENPCGYEYVNHIDYDTKNNLATNLEWCTQGANVRHSVERMKHPKTESKTNTGERYITYRRGRYRVTINHKEYPTCATLEEAIRERDRIIKETRA